MQSKSKHLLKKTVAALLLCVLPFAAFGLLLLIKAGYARWIAPYILPCLLRTFTGWLCPACGMTHSVYAVCRLDFLTALRENAMIPLACIPLLLGYAELWLRAMGHTKALFPRSSRFWYGVIAAWMLYAVIRNLI